MVQHCKHAPVCIIYVISIVYMFSSELHVAQNLINNGLVSSYLNQSYPLLDTGIEVALVGFWLRF